MDSLQEENHSRKGRGGTLGTYASYISGFLKEIKSTAALRRINDAQFSAYLQKLLEEKEVRNGLLSTVRLRTTVNAMAVVLLEFIAFCSKYHNDTAMIGEYGRVKAYKKSVVKTDSNGKLRHTVEWVHRMLGPNDPVNRRLPIWEQDLKALRGTASLTANDFIRARRQALIVLLDTTGMRRMEATMLTVGQVRSAILEMELSHSDLPTGQSELIQMLGPYALEFHTVKHKSVSRRIVPVDAIALQFFDSYLSMRKIYLRKIGAYSDATSAAFLCSETTGAALMPNTITQEFRNMKLAAGITRSCSPHLIRHLYIVRLFIRFLLSHKIENNDQFNQALISSAKFKEMVRELCGHASIDSLEPYLSWAVDQITNLKMTVSRVQYQSYVDRLAEISEILKNDVSRGRSSANAFEDLTRAISALNIPLNFSYPAQEGSID